MGRNKIRGLKYFPLEVGMFEDHKMLLIEERHKFDGCYVALRLMAMVYEQGYYLEWKPFQEVTCAKRVGGSFTGAGIMEVLQTCLEVDLFDREIFEQHHVLTSCGIQKRWLEIQIQLRHKLDDEKAFWLINDAEKNINAEEITPPPTITPVPPAKSTQKKRKEKKTKVVKESTVTPTGVSTDGDKSPEPKTFKHWTEEEFINEIQLHKEKFPYAMRNEFFKYWKERSPGGKMRFQLEKTWETNLRLETWKRRDDQKSFKNGTHIKTPTTVGNKQRGAAELLEEIRSEHEQDQQRAANY